MEAPLQDVRIVEVASFVAAPAAGALLADLGADVIKVELPGGEVLRHSRPKLMGVRSDFPEAPQFHMDNRGKRSLVLDLRREEARAALQRVIDGADVVLMNLLPQRQRKYGLLPETLRRERPELIVARLSGYGPTGPDAETPAFDYAAYWARTGLMDQFREPDAAPVFLRPGVGDHAAALALTTGILSALRVRDRGGEGQVLDVDLMHVGYYVQGNDAAIALATGQAPPRHDRSAPRNPLWSHYETSDERWLFLVMIESDRYWPALCEALERPEWLGDERFRDARERYRNNTALAAAMAAIFRTRSLADWSKRLGDFDLIWAPANTLEEALEDPQARAAGIFQRVDAPELPPLETIAPPLRLSSFPMRGERPAPGLGADSEAILREAGLADAEVERALRTDAD